jgi:hypothetical protein
MAGKICELGGPRILTCESMDALIKEATAEIEAAQEGAGYVLRITIGNYAILYCPICGRGLTETTAKKEGV